MIGRNISALFCLIPSPVLFDELLSEGHKFFFSAFVIEWLYTNRRFTSLQEVHYALTVCATEGLVLFYYPLTFVRIFSQLNHERNLDIPRFDIA